MFCAVCEKLSETIFSDSLALDEPVIVGTSRELQNRARSCTCCQDLLKYFEHHAANLHPRERSGATFFLALTKISPAPRFVAYFEYGHTIISPVNGALYKRKDEGRYWASISYPWIDPTRLREWLNLCDKHHVGACHTLPEWQKIEPVATLLLIDVFRNCLVELPGTIKYAALSYVWGNTPNCIETRMVNVDYLKRDNSLEGILNGLRIPGTVRDAIQLTRCLGLRYLCKSRPESELLVIFG